VNENSRRQLSIAKGLATWAAAIPRLLRKIDVVLELSDITETQALAIEVIEERVGTVLRTIVDAVKTDASYDLLIAITDRLREEIMEGDLALDRMLQRASQPT
jgi:hypothetical protein